MSTPPLRERPEDLPVLAGFFLRLAARRMGKGELFLSRGALDKLTDHTWQGNVRELKNCLIRAAALARAGDHPGRGCAFRGRTRPGQPQAVVAPLAEPPAEVTGVVPLNARQRRALRDLYGRESFSRQDYQEAGGEGVPQRTAQHDLQDLVSRGIVLKEGRGPATRYRMAREYAG